MKKGKAPNGGHSPKEERGLGQGGS